MIAVVAFLIGGPVGAAVAVIAWVALRWRGWRHVGWSAIGVIAVIALVSALHATAPAAFGVWVTSTLWPQELGLSAIILVAVALAGAATETGTGADTDVG